MTMKKISNYFILKIKSFKIPMVFLVAFIYQLYIFSKVTCSEMNYNVYDVSMKYFSDLSLFYSVNLFYLIIIYQVFNNNFSKYLFLKFKGKTNVFNINVLILFMLCFIFVGIVNLACIIGAIDNINFENTWSQYFFQIMSGTINSFHLSESIRFLITDLTPLSLTLYNNLFTILHLFLIGLIFIISNIIFKKRMVSFVFTITITASSLILELTPCILHKLPFKKNIFVLNATLEQLKDNTFITSRLLYFGVLIIALIVIGNMLTKKLNYKFQKEKC